MLEGVVKQYDLGGISVFEQVFHAFDAVFIHGDLNVVELVEVLQRLVANGFVCAFAVGELETACLTSIPTTQGCHMVLILQQLDKVFYCRGFSRSAKVEVAHTNHWHVESDGFQDMPIV